MEEVQLNRLLLSDSLAYIQAVSNNMIFVITICCIPPPMYLLQGCCFEAKSAPASKENPPFGLEVLHILQSVNTVVQLYTSVPCGCCYIAYLYDLVCPSVILFYVLLFHQLQKSVQDKSSKGAFTVMFAVNLW